MKKHRAIKKKNTLIKGSFLLELLLAFAVISITMTVVVESFLSSQKTYKRIADEGTLTKALSSVLENITREARVSKEFRCELSGTSPCTSTDTFYMTHVMGLNDQDANEFIAYTLSEDGVIKKNNVDMTPPTIRVDYFNIRIIESPSQQTQAVIALSAYSTENAQAKVYLQTSFTERWY